MEEIRIVIRRGARKLYCLPTKFDRCEIHEPQYFRDDRDLEAIWRSNYELLGQCSTRVAVSDRNGFIAYYVPEIYRRIN